MNAKVLGQAFGQLSTQQQVRLLAAWAHAATIDARDTYIAGTEGIADPVRLRGFNELQHRMSSQMKKILNEDDERYADDVFLATVLESRRELRSGLLEEEVTKFSAGPGGNASKKHRRAG